MSKHTAVKEINAAILARVSTKKQEDNSSLEGQLNAGRAYCAQRGYNIIAERKEIHSGAFVLARSVFAELLDMAADGLIQVIVVDVPDRLGRGKPRSIMEYMAELNGARVEYVSGLRDTSTPEGVAQDGVETIVSGLERIRIKERMMKGIKNRIAEGRVIAPPIRPYGYRIVSERDERGRKVSCTLEIIESEERVIRDIYEWCVYECMTLNAIVNRLNARQIPRMSDTDPETQKAHLAIAAAGRTSYTGWGRTQVRNILRNTLYRGQWQYGKMRIQRIDAPGKVQRKTTRNGEDSILTVDVPAIIPLELWNAAQEQMEENKRKFMHPPINEYVLRGRLRCATCGKIRVGHGAKRRNGTIVRYYECTNARPGGMKPEIECKGRYLRADYAEAAVWNSIRDVMLEPDRLWVGVRKSNEANKKARRILEQAIAAEQAEIDKVHNKEERLLDLFESKGITKEKYFARLAEHRAEIDKHDAEKKRIMERLGECAVLTPEQEETLHHFQHAIASRMTDDVPAVDRMQLYDILRVQCVYNSDTGEMVISGLFGEATVHDACAP